MKAFKVVYKHGHFIDVESGLRLIPVQGSEYTISAPDKAFKTEDAKLKIGDALNTENKATWAEKEFGKGNYAKILDAGEQLFFRVGNSKKMEGDESRQYIFVCTLLEDLYFYLVKRRKGDDAVDWRLANCQCMLESCLLGGLAITEKIPAVSLNTLFTQTVMFYFNMQRSGAINVYDAFYKYTQGMEITFDGATYQFYNSIGKVRNAFVKNRNLNQKPLFS